ncbi:hypothetical protein P3S68_019972 [Capsicum galapagoense]
MINTTQHSDETAETTKVDGVVLTTESPAIKIKITESVLHSSSPKDLWKYLEEIFGQTSGTQLFQLQKLLSVRSNILISSPLPSTGQAYSLIVQDEKQRKFHVPAVHPADSSSFHASNQPGERKFNDYKIQKVVNKCYRIHGFSTDFKFTKQRRYQKNAQANNSFETAEEQVGSNGPNIKSLTQENMEQLLEFFQQIKTAKHDENTPEASASMSFAGKAKFFNSYAYIVNFDSNSWILDSEATQHMTHNKSILTNLKALPKPLMVRPFSEEPTGNR